jgi:Zn finger protein HypA/HybF involved in hydrogenase expression
LILRCDHCAHEYKANGFDAHERRCPKCQGGMPGL